MLYLKGLLLLVTTMHTSCLARLMAFTGKHAGKDKMQAAQSSSTGGTARVGISIDALSWKLGLTSGVLREEGEFCGGMFEFMECNKGCAWVRRNGLEGRPGYKPEAWNRANV